MTLASGTRLGPYEILAPLGAGGMGEVYRARDTRLDRDVAIKILPDAFAADPERRARFEREAKTLASLNHQNIAHIHGIEESGDVRALVMELVEGPTLADRIAQGPIAIGEVLPIAKQIADALEAAHEQGIIHRDLKPANVNVRGDGTVKVLDFGLAKALDPVASASIQSQSPTLTLGATMAGVILGTAAYAAPEQARGKTVDKRADVWAFGCVLFEMLTGRRAFEGDDVSITLAAVMMKEPDWTALPAAATPALRRLLRSCLEKDPKQRLQAIGDARLEIERLLGGALEETFAPAIAVAVPPWRRALPWALAGALALALLTVLALWAPWRTAPPAAPLRLEATIGADVSIVNLGASLALSSDGSILAFAAQDSQGQKLYIRRLGELRATPLAGTANARDPFFSPDGQWIAFFADGKLKKISATGGAAVTLCDAGDARGGTWAEDGSIVFQPAAAGAGLSRVSSAGGAPAPLTKLGTGEVTQRWPQVLPGGKAVLYTAHSTVSGFDDATIVLQPLPDGAPKVVQRGGYYGRYLRSGHLVYVHQGTLFAEPFDLARLEPAGQPVPVMEGISSYPGTGGGAGFSGSAQMAWTETGTAIYLAGGNVADEAPIQWMDRTGKVTALRATPTNWSSPAFSPDGRRLAIDINNGQADVFVYEWARDTLTRVTFDAKTDAKPVWTPDGRRIVFRSDRDKTFNLYWQRADGSGDVQRLTEGPNSQVPASWHLSGKFLAFTETRPQTGNDLMILPIEGNDASGWKPGKPTVFLSTPFNELEPMFSPDGRWIAYFSAESGRFEVYVRPFPGPGGKWQISTDGGVLPVWSRTRDEIFYGSPDNRLMAASYAVEGESFRADKPRVWSERRFTQRGLRNFNLHPDGERFALAAAPENESAVKQDKLVFIFNFFDELRRIAPVTTR